MLNITDCKEDLERYKDSQDIIAFCDKFCCDGFEYMPVMNQEQAKIPKQMIYGVHMRSFSCLLDLWLGNETALLKEFGSWEVVEQTYGGRDREAIIQYFRKDLELAKRLQAEYVVFHVTEVKIAESCTYCFDYTDEEVVDVLAEIVNELLDGRDYQFYFLMENLWWPGLTFTRPEITKRLIRQVHYEKKGFMLDTGHLMHTNLELKSQEEGLVYIKEMLLAHGELCKWIKGVHLQQSITGERVKEMLKQEIQWEPEYYQRWCQIFEYIFEIDLHQPFTAKGIQELITWINPEYLTFEFISRSREEHEKLLTAQIECFF